MKVLLSTKEEAMKVVKRIVFLAYSAVGGTTGMGFLQAARLGGGSADEETVWRCAYNAEDYPGGFRGGKENEVYCDYVFGRMMKWGCSFKDNVITIRDSEFRGDYQGFSRTYPNNKALVAAALDSLGITAEIA